MFTPEVKRSLCWRLTHLEDWICGYTVRDAVKFYAAQLLLAFIGRTINMFVNPQNFNDKTDLILNWSTFGVHGLLTVVVIMSVAQRSPTLMMVTIVLSVLQAVAGVGTFTTIFVKSPRWSLGRSGTLFSLILDLATNTILPVSMMFFIISYYNFLRKHTNFPKGWYYNEFGQYVMFDRKLKTGGWVIAEFNRQGQWIRLNEPEIRPDLSLVPMQDETTAAE